MKSDRIFYGQPDRNTIMVFIDDILHLKIPKRVLSIQSWVAVTDDKVSYPAGRKYCIEYHFKGKSVLSEYNDRAMWEDILDYMSRETKTPWLCR